jgi:hypothetical protein
MRKRTHAQIRQAQARSAAVAREPRHGSIIKCHSQSVRIAGCQPTSRGAPSTALALADKDEWLRHLVRLELYLKIASACKELLHALF